MTGLATMIAVDRQAGGFEGRAIEDLAADRMAGADAAVAWCLARRVATIFCGGAPARLAVLFGAAAAESGGFQMIDPILSRTGAAADDGRLGNERPGDGMRYRARGWLDDRGRDRYVALSQALGLPLVADPDRLADPVTAWQAAAVRLRQRVHGATAAEWADAGRFDMAVRPLVFRSDRAHAVALTRRALEILTAG